MLEKPSELLLYGPVEEGGLGLHHVQRLLKILISLKHILFFLCILFSFSAYVVCCFCPSVCSIHSILFSTLHISYVMFCYVMFLFLWFHATFPYISIISFYIFRFIHLILIISLYACVRVHTSMCTFFNASIVMHLILFISFHASLSLHFILF